MYKPAGIYSCCIYFHDTLGVLRLYIFMKAMTSSSDGSISFGCFEGADEAVGGELRLMLTLQPVKFMVG